MSKRSRNRGNCSPIFWTVVHLWKNSLVRNFWSKSEKFEAEKNPVADFRGKVEILSSRNAICWKFASVCGNSVGNLKCLPENCNFLYAAYFLDTYSYTMVSPLD